MGKSSLQMIQDVKWVVEILKLDHQNKYFWLAIPLGNCGIEEMTQYGLSSTRDLSIGKWRVFAATNEIMEYDIKRS